MENINLKRPILKFFSNYLIVNTGTNPDSGWPRIFFFLLTVVYGGLIPKLSYMKGQIVITIFFFIKIADEFIV